MADLYGYSTPEEVLNEVKSILMVKDGHKVTEVARGIRAEVNNLCNKIQYLVNFLEDNNLLEDGTFTFPDEETWYSSPKSMETQDGKS